MKGGSLSRVLQQGAGNKKSAIHLRAQERATCCSQRSKIFISTKKPGNARKGSAKEEGDISGNGEKKMFKSAHQKRKQ